MFQPEKILQFSENKFSFQQSQLALLHNLILYEQFEATLNIFLLQDMQNETNIIDQNKIK